MAKTQLDTALERLRAKLLDLSHRNRLLNFQEQGAKVVRIIDELPDQVYSHLVDKQASMILEPKEPPADTLADKSEDLDEGKMRHDQQGMLQHALAEAIERVESDSNDDAKEREAEELDLTGDLPEELAEDFVQTWRHRDDRLQTTLTHDQLEGRMRRIHTEYKNFIDSTGANLLFLAIGFPSTRR